MDPIVMYIYLTCYVLTIPCIFIHFWIIVTTVCRRKHNVPVNYLEANLSFGVMLNQIINGFFIITSKYNIWAYQLCGTRTYFKGSVLAVVTFTLVRIATEQIYISRKNFHSSFRTSLINVIVIDVVAFVFCIPIIYSKHYDPSSTITSKCVKNFFMDSEELDWITRGFLFLVMTIIPAAILLREMRRMIRNILEINSPDIEKMNLQDGEYPMERYRLMKSACVFIGIFLCYSAPVAILEILDAPSFVMEPTTRYYKSMAQHIIYLIGYIVITIFPICIFYKNRRIYDSG